MPTTRGTGALAFLQAEPPAALTGPVDLHPAPARAALSSQPAATALVVTSYAQARALLSDRRWVRHPSGDPHQVTGPASAMSVTEMDPPRHSQVRGFVARMFSPRTVRQLRTTIQQRATDLVNQIARSKNASGDLLIDFCAPFTFAVQCDLLGIPEDFRASVHKASLLRSDRVDASPREIYDAEVALDAEVSEILRAIYRGGGAGAFGQLLEIHRQGILTATELTGLASSLLFDGHILAAAQIGTSIASLLCHAQASTTVVAAPLPHTSLEELLRWAPAITLGMPRVASEGLRMAGKSVAPGQVAVVAFGLVNRDPSAFDNPDVLASYSPPEPPSFLRIRHPSLPGRLSSTHGVRHRRQHRVAEHPNHDSGDR